MSITNKQLVEYVKGQIGRPYWFGTFGQKASTSLLTAKRKQYPSYYEDADFALQFGKKVHDCGGLIKGAIFCDGAIDAAPKYNKKYDVDSDTMLNQCSESGSISSIPEIEGALVFKKGHVGVYIGGGKVVEARGHRYGVIESNLGDMPWTNWGKHKDIEYIVENKAEMVVPECTGTITHWAETVVPEVPKEKITNYTVEAGDTLSGICGRFGVNMDDVVRWNNISNPNIIRVGLVLTLVGVVNNVVTLTVNANGGLRLRETPNGTIILTMPNGSNVEKIGADGNWYKVKYNGYTGYSHSDYLK